MKVSERTARRIQSVCGVSLPVGISLAEAFDLMCEKHSIDANKVFKTNMKEKTFKTFVNKAFCTDGKADFVDMCRLSFIKYRNGRWRKELDKKIKAEYRIKVFKSFSDPVSDLVADPAHKTVICNLPASKFYKTPEWRRLRYLALTRLGKKCCVCGTEPKDGKSLEVDHIQPRHIFPEHALEFWNLQVLCNDCHIGKSLQKNDYNWREKCH